MTDKEFIQYAVSHVKEYLPEDFADAQVSTQTVVQPNDAKYTSLTLLRPDDEVGPRVPLEDFAALVRQGKSLDSVMKEIANVFTSFRTPAIAPVQDIFNFDAMKGYLTTKLCDPDNARDYLKDKPWTPVGRWGLLYRLKLAIRDDVVGSAPVTYEILNGWGLDTETLHREAVANESSKDPAWLSPVAEIITMGPAVSGPNLLESGKKLKAASTGLYVLSNKSRFNGACVVGWEGVLDRVGEVLGCDFAVVPSSIHEVMIVPDAGLCDPQGLENMLQAGNANPAMVQTEDILSNHVQFYNRATRQLEGLEVRQRR